MNVWLLPLLASVGIAACSARDDAVVSDPSLCQDRVEAHLFQNRRALEDPKNLGPEFYVLDGSKSGDVDLALAYMRKGGWTAWASSKPEDQKKLYLIPNRDAGYPNIPIGNEADGPRLACRASQVANIPFVLVQRRSNDLSKVVYEFKP